MKNTFYIFLSVALLFSCQPEEIPNDNEPKIFEPTDFAVDVFKTIVNAEENEKNVIISPLSMESAFLMAANGANGETRNEILSVLGVENNDMSTINSTYKDLLSMLDYQSDTTRFEMANALFWDNQRIQMKPEYLATVSEKYAAEQHQYDFDLAASKDSLNSWVNEKTEGRINKIIDNILPDDVLFLINALYFTGDWDNGFEETATNEGEFTLSNGTVVNVPFMHKNQTLSAFANDEYQALDLSFRNEDFSMTFLMPKTKTINQFINDLTLEELDSLYASKLEPSFVYVRLPKFELEYKILLNQSLKEMGMELPFSDLADFSLLGDANGNLQIKKALQKTYLRIDEKGAEGAAVTAISVGTTSVGGALVFDKPFVAILKNHKTNSYLFMAKIATPE